MKAFNFQNVSELIADIERNKNSGYVVFSGTKIIQDLATSVHSQVVLCSTSGEFTPDGYSNQAITGFTYDPKNVEVVEITYPPAKCLNSLKNAYNKLKHNKNAFAFLLCDGLSSMEEAIVTTFFFAESDFKIIGGSAGDNLQFKETLIYMGGQRVHSLALFVDAKSKTQIIKENLYVPMNKRMLVTEADPITRTVNKFNNQPASKEYARQLGISESDLSKYFMSNPLGRTLNDDTFIASPMKVNSDQSITFYSQILPNTFVDILELADYNKVVLTTKQQITIEPKFAISINCILRSLYFIESGKWKTVNTEMLGICKNHTGFVSYGEQYYKNHFNQTMVMLLME